MLKSNNLTKTFFFNFKSVLKLRISSKYIIGSSILFSSLYYLFSKSRVRLVAKIEKPKIEELSLAQLSKNLSLGIPEFFIFYYDTNELQIEMGELFSKGLKEYLTKNYPDLEYKVNPININNIKNDDIALKILKNLGVNDYEKLRIDTEPIICLNYGMLLENLNPLSFVNKFHSYIVKEKLNNLLLYEIINDYDELRIKMEYLDNPKNKVILFPLFDQEIDTNTKYVLSLLKSKNHKIFLTNSLSLIEKLNLEKGCYYIYYPPKLPFTTRNLDKIPAQEENIDVKSYIGNNPYGLMLRYGIYRDKFKISEDLLKNCLNDFRENLFTGFNFFDRNKYLKSSTYAFRNVKVLANVNKSSIQKNWSIPNKQYLFIWLPNYSYLKESTFEFILFDSNHLLDEIQIVTSKDFAIKNEIFDTFQLSATLPQIFLIETKNGRDRKIYNLNYFRFAKDFNNYLKGSQKMFSFKDNNIDNLTYVETINSLNFKEKIIDDKSFKEFIIEIKHEGCPTCYILGKMLDHLSQKFKKHKINKVKFFRIDTANDLPYLGEFLATPTYLHCRKNEKGEIVQISPLEKQNFIFDLRKASSYDLSKIRYHPNIGIGNHIYLQKEFLKKNYDPDMDLESFILK